jgi:hypothetical protein
VDDDVESSSEIIERGIEKSIEDLFGYPSVAYPFPLVKQFIKDKKGAPPQNYNRKM